MLFGESRYTIEERELSPSPHATSLTAKISRTPFGFCALPRDGKQCHVYSILGLGEIGIFQATRGEATLILTVVLFPQESEQQMPFCGILLETALSYSEKKPSAESPFILRGKVDAETHAIKKAYLDLNLPNDGLSVRSIITAHRFYSPETKDTSPITPAMRNAGG